MLHQNVIIYMARGKRRGPEANDALQRAATICRERGARDPVPRTRSGPLREREREREREIEREIWFRERGERKIEREMGGQERRRPEAKIGELEILFRERDIYLRDLVQRERGREWKREVRSSSCGGRQPSVRVQARKRAGLEREGERDS